MKEQYGAMSLAESQLRFKIDVSLIFGNQRKERKYVLRTTLHSLAVWKTRNPGVSTSPFKLKNMNIQKDAAIIEKEVWVFGINGTIAQDIAASVKVASQYYNVFPATLLSDIYAKNLNAERENNLENQLLIKANKDLYTSTCNAILQATAQLGVPSEINFYIFSRNNNPKIPRDELHKALKSGGATSVETDKRRYKVNTAKNDDSQFITQMTNFHIASMNV